jgi:hypothetical protein
VKTWFQAFAFKFNLYRYTAAAGLLGQFGPPPSPTPNPRPNPTPRSHPPLTPTPDEAPPSLTSTSHESIRVVVVQGGRRHRRPLI